MNGSPADRKFPEFLVLSFEWLRIAEKYLALITSISVLSAMPIPRRSFLITVAASVIPPVTLREVMAQVPSTTPASSPDLQIVSSGEDRYGEKHSNGYSTISFKVSTAETGGNMFVLEHTNLVPNGGPALHVHSSREEYFYVLEGEVAFQIGNQKFSLKTGESILGPRRVPHCFAGVQTSRLLIAFAPAGQMEEFFREAQQNPMLLKDPEFHRRFDSEMIGPSPFWKSR